MKEEDKNRKPELSDFLKYQKSEMTDQQRNVFERNLQKDPFAEEAAEGFSQINPNDATSDLKILEKRLKVRFAYNRRIIYYHIAASLAVILVISSVFFFTQRNKSSLLQEPIAQNQTVFEVPESKALKEPYNDQKVQISEFGSGKEESSVPSELNDALAVVEIPEKEKITEAKRAEVNTREEDYKAAQYNVADKLAAPAAASSRSEPANIKIKGKVIAADDNQPIAGATILVKDTDLGTVTDTGGYFNITVPGNTNPVLLAEFIGMETKEVPVTDKAINEIILSPSMLALNEVVVTGYGVSKRSKAVGAVAADQDKAEHYNTGYIPSAPVNGKESFDKYIKENIRKPASLPEGERVVVVISFTVSSSGVIENIKIIRSQGQEFSDESVRLIKEGPAWKPAEENGEKIDDEVKMRINFK